MEIPYTVQPRADTGLYNAKVGIWLFLASEVMLFGGLFSAYILLRVGAGRHWPHGWLNVRFGTLNTLVLALSAITTLMAWVACKMRQFGKFKFFHACTLLLALTFLCIKMYEYHDKWIHYEIQLTDGRIADGHLVSQNDKEVVIEGRYVSDEKDLYDLRAQKNIRTQGNHHRTFATSREWKTTARGITLTWRFISRSPACTRCTSSAAASSSAILWGPGSRMWKKDPEQFHQPRRGLRPVLAFRGPGLDIFCFPSYI